MESPYDADRGDIERGLSSVRVVLWSVSRPYRDAAEVATEPIPDRRAPWIPADAVMVRGVWQPGAPDPIPLVLLPCFEYRLRLAPDTDPEDERASAWIIERRRVGDRE